MYSLACMDPEILYHENLGLTAAGVIRVFEKKNLGSTGTLRMLSCVGKGGEVAPLPRPSAAKGDGPSLGGHP